MNKIEDEKINIICSNSRDSVLPGFTCNCESCNAEVWMCDATMDGMKERFPDKLYSEYSIICSKCFEKDHKITPEYIVDQYKKLTPTQKEILREQLIIRFGDIVKGSVFFED